jgi:hypothetical protein
MRGGLLILPPPSPMTLPFTCDNGGGDGMNARDPAPKEDEDDVLVPVLLVRGDDVEAVRCEREGACVEELSSS